MILQDFMALEHFSWTIIQTGRRNVILGGLDVNIYLVLLHFSTCPLPHKTWA